MPAVAELSETACGAPVSSQNFPSKAWHSGPVVIHPDFRHRTTSSISRGPMEGLEKGRKSSLIFIFYPFPAFRCSR